MLLEEDWVVLRDMGAYVAEGGRRGDNLIREYDAGMRIRLRRALRDRARRMPAFEVPCRACAGWALHIGHPVSLCASPARTTASWAVSSLLQR